MLLYKEKAPEKGILSLSRYLLFAVFIMYAMACFSAYGQEIKAMTLQESIDSAMANNLTIKNAQEKVKTAEEKVKEARGAFMPSVSATGAYMYYGNLPTISFDPTALGLPPGLVPGGSGSSEIPMGNEDTYTVGIGIQQTLFAWGKISNNYKQAKLSLEAANLELAAAKQQIVLDVTTSFYGVLLTDKMVKVADMAVDQVQAHLKVAQDLVDAGMATNFDLLRAKVQLANIKTQAIRAKNGYKLALDAFKNIMGMDLGSQIELKGELEYKPVELELSKLIEMAMANRPELKQMAYQQQALERLLKIAKAANKPNAALSFDYSYQSYADTLSDAFKSDQWSNIWSITFGIKWPIFDGLATRARVKQSESGLRQMQNGIELLKDGVELEVRAGFLSYQDSGELLNAQREAIQQAEESLRIANLSHENGMITTVELMDAELANTQTQTNYYNALHDYMIAMAKLEKATASKLN